MTEGQRWYKEYLDSSHWQDMRRKAFERYGRACTVIGFKIKRLNVHHLSYEFVGEEQEINDVRPLCWWHHWWAHHRLWKFQKIPLNRKELTKRYLEIRRFVFLRMRPSDWFRL